MAADREPRDGQSEEWGDEPELPEDAPPYWFAGQTLPEHARAMGLTHHVPEGAILDFAGRLDSAKPGHKAAAWCLLVLFGTPVVLAVLRVYYAFS